MTPREFNLILGAESERRFDSYEDLAHSALMNRIANNKEKLKKEDLFERPEDSIEYMVRDKQLKDEAQKMQEQQELLERLNF